LRPEVFRSHVLDQVRFVENHRCVIRQNRAIAVVAQIQIGKEEVMVDDDDVSFLRAIPHARDEAGIEVGTLLAQARLGTRVDVAPE
jgi:hypothetical protein